MTAIDFDYTGQYTIVLTESYRDQYNIITRGTTTLVTVTIEKLTLYGWVHFNINITNGIY